MDESDGEIIMADFSGAPVSDAYYQRVDANNQQSARNLQSLAQMMTLQRQQQEMAQAPEDRMLKRRLIESQIGEQDFKVAQSRITQAREAEKQALIAEWSALPDTDPRKPMLQQKLRVLIDPGNALDPAKTSNLPWYVQRGPDGKTSIDPAYQDFEAMKASKGGTKVITPAPISQIHVTEDDPTSTYFGKNVVKDGRTGKTLGLDSKLGDISKADLKLSQSLPQAKQRTEAMTQNLDKLDSALVALDKHPGLPYITGTIYGRTPSLRDDAIDAQAQLNSITSQIFQDSLQAMREASKTGGAVGNVSDREGDKLERTMGALDRAQTTESFKDQVKKVRQQVKQSTAIIKAAFKDQYDGVEPYRSPNTAPKPALGGGKEEVWVRGPDGKLVKQ